MKKIKVLFSLFLLLGGLSSQVFSQDIIILKTGEELQAKVDEVGLDAIKYKKFDNLTGPMYTIEKVKVFMIKYENGSKDVFNEQPAVQTQVITPSGTQPTVSQPVVELPKPKVYQKLEYAGGGNIKLNNRVLSTAEVKTIMAPHSSALATYSSGKNLKVTGDVLEVVGYGCLVLMILRSKAAGEATGQDKVDYEAAAQSAAATGIVAFVASIVFEGVGKSKMKSSVGLYNSSALNLSSFNFKIVPNGVGLVLNF
jgi:hypothetical protein